MQRQLFAPRFDFTQVKKPDLQNKYKRLDLWTWNSIKQFIDNIECLFVLPSDKFANDQIIIIDHFLIGEEKKKRFSKYLHTKFYPVFEKKTTLFSNAEIFIMRFFTFIFQDALLSILSLSLYLFLTKPTIYVQPLTHF